MTPSWIEPLFLSPGVVAGTTTRGKAKNSPYSAFNLCHYTGDGPAHVVSCRDELCRFLGIDDWRLVVPRQTHSTSCRVIDSVPIMQEALEGVDAVVTMLENVAIGVSTADCVPVVMLEPERRLIAAVHAGWRGAVGGVVQETIRVMVSLGATPGLIKAAIGPCICQDCFEVGNEVAEKFPERFVDRSREKPHVDLVAYVCHLLKQCGVNDVAMAIGCTRCAPERYFSARKLGIESGRNFTFIMLHPRKT